MLNACAGNVPMYNYENMHTLDFALQNNNMCVVIDNQRTLYAKGVQRLGIDPFLGNEDYSPDNVFKTRRNHNYVYKNKSCKNPIKISRYIKVSSIVYPGICEEQVYAGSVYTGSTTYSYDFGYNSNMYGSYPDNATTNFKSVPVYNTHRYPCIKERYFTEIEFYQNSKYLGKIENKFWNTYDTDYIIDVYTKEFIKILNKSK